MYLLLKGSAHSLRAPWFLVFVPSGSDLLSADHSQGISCKEFSPAAEFKKGNTRGHALICTHKRGLSCLPTPPTTTARATRSFLTSFVISSGPEVGQGGYRLKVVMEWVTFVPFPMLFAFMRSLSCKRICTVPFPVLVKIFITTRRYQVLTPGVLFNCFQ